MYFYVTAYSQAPRRYGDMAPGPTPEHFCLQLFPRRRNKSGPRSRRIKAATDMASRLRVVAHPWRRTRTTACWQNRTQCPTLQCPKDRQPMQGVGADCGRIMVDHRAGLPFRYILCHLSRLLLLHRTVTASIASEPFIHRDNEHARPSRRNLQRKSIV